MSKDSKITIQILSREFIKPSNYSPPQPIITPSNLDYISGNISAQLFTIYSNPSTPTTFNSIISTFRNSLPHFLNFFYPFAGRLIPDKQTGLLRIHCNNAGAELVVAQCNLPLFLIPFHDVTKSLDHLKISYDEEVNLSVQLVGFPCGGFSIMWGTNHIMIDGKTIIMIPNLWAEFVRSNNISVIPFHDRSIFKPREPLKYSKEIESMFVERVSDNIINVLSSAAFVRRLYIIEGKDVERLRVLCSRNGRKATRLEAISAYLWKSLAAVTGDADDKCRMVWWADWRQRLNRPELINYAGNVVSFVTKESRVTEIAGGSYADVAEMVAAAIEEGTRNASEQLQEQVDWMENWKRMNGGKKSVLRLLLGLGSPTVVMTTFHHLKMDMDFGLGQPGLVTPHIPSGRFGRGYVIVSPRLKGVGGLVLSAYLWRQLADKVENDGERVLCPATPESLGLVQPPPCRNKL